MGVMGMLIMIPLSSVLYALFREFIVKRLRTKTARVQKMFFTRVQRPAAETAAAESVPAGDVSKPATRPAKKKK